MKFRLSAKYYKFLLKLSNKNEEDNKSLKRISELLKFLILENDIVIIERIRLFIHHLFGCHHRRHPLFFRLPRLGSFQFHHNLLAFKLSFSQTQVIFKLVVEEALKIRSIKKYFF
jgi:hypothetical protein